MMFTGADGGSSSLPWLASPTWGTSAFSGCLRCRRSRDCPNPLKKFLVAGRPCLQFQSDRHYMCNCCRGAIRQTEPALLAKGSTSAKDSRLAEIKVDDTKWEQHCHVVKAWEDVQNGEKPATVASRKRKRNDADPDDTKDTREIIVLGSSGKELKVEQCLGVLWPVKVYEKVEGKKPEPKQVDYNAQTNP